MMTGLAFTPSGAHRLLVSTPTSTLPDAPDEIGISTYRAKDARTEMMI